MYILQHDVLAKSRNTSGTDWTTGKSLGVSSDPFSSLKGGNQKTGDVAGLQADPSRPNTPRPLRCVAGCSPTTTKLTITPTPIKMADGSRETKAPEGLTWGTYNNPFSPQHSTTPCPHPPFPDNLLSDSKTLC